MAASVETLSRNIRTWSRQRQARGEELSVHGWIYGLCDGCLRGLRATAASAGEASTLGRHTRAALK